YNFKIHKLILALLFAIEEINRNPHLLPNISLGFDFYNVPFSERNILGNALIWLSGLSMSISNYNCVKERKSAAALTGLSWTRSAHIGTLLQLYKFPQLTVGPFDPILSDRSQFYSLYQMAPKDTSLSLAMVSLMLHFGWTWVGLIVPDDHRGIQFLSDIRKNMENNQVCTAFVEMIPSTWNAFSKTFWKNIGIVQESLANVIIIYGDNDSLQGLIRNLGQQIFTTKVWIMITQWDITNIADYFLLDSFHGSLIFSHHHEQMDEFKNFIQTVNPYKYPEDNYLPKLWFLFFKCSFSEHDCQLLENCQLNASLELVPRHIFDMTMNEDSYNIYKAVYTVAQSLHEMSLQQVQMQPFGKRERMVFFPWQLHPFLKNIHVGGNTALEWKQKLDDKYDILNFWNFPKGLGLKVKVGIFSPNAPQGQQLSLSEEMIRWPEKYSEIPKSACSESCGPGFKKVTPEGKAVCCYDCTPCPDNEISNETDVDQCMKCPESHYANTEKKHCLQKAIIFGGAFTVALATVLAKAITVVIAFKVTFPRRVVRWLIISKAPNFIIPICALVHLVLCGIWLGTSPPFLDKDYHAEDGNIIIMCNKGSAFAFH
ncbi:hypothetical protein A6R68_09519, partial [Neotoma lepida]